MSVVGGKALQEQLSAVLEALTRAALAEICGLVEEGYSVLQLEISRSHKENRDLKAKLHLIQSILVRGGHGESQAAAPAKEEEEEEEESGAAAAAVAAAVRPETPSRRGDTGVEREEVPDVVLIKDEDSDGDDSLEDGERGGGAASVSEGAPSTRTARRRRRRSRAQDDDGSSALKTSRQDVPVYSLDSPGSSPPVPDGVRANAADDYASPTDPDVQLVQDCSLAPPVLSRQAFFSGDALMEAPPPPVRSNLDLDPEWTNQPKASMTFAQFCPSDGVEADTFGLKLVGDAASSAFEYGGGVLNFGLYGGEPPDNDADAQRKRFVCSMCNKTYATAQNLEVHTRIHTGERPFACEQCGKKFTQSAHLRSHLNVHTGARPYACTLCPRSFIVKYSLKLHMKKCHPTN